MNISENMEKKQPVVKVLIVDDSEIILKLVRSYLKADNYDVYIAENGRKAFELIEEIKNFDLVVLDVMLPDVSGFEICRTIRQSFSLYELPVLFLTGLKEIMNIVEGFSAGGNDYLVKPFNSQEFMVRAQTLIKLKKLTQANEALHEAIEIKNRALIQLQHEIAYRLKIEKELTKAKEIADEANLLKSQFLANMTHEIRTPMNAILGFSELLKDRIQDEKSKGYIESVITSGKNLLVVINDILDLSKIEAGKIDFEFGPVNIRQIITEVGQVLALKIEEKNLSFLTEISDHLPQYLNLDETRIRQIILNLAGNAVKFTSQGSVEVRVIHSGINKLNNTLNLSIIISDTGVGISSDQLDLIFEAFTQHRGQSKKAYGGTGLGLTITKKLVELMGGSIRVDSTVGKGSSFFIHLPDIQYFEKNFEQEEQQEEVHIGTFQFLPANVLIVDDIPGDLELVSEYLSETGLSVYKLISTKSIQDFLGTTRPDLILMDLKMPEIDGYQAKDMIRSNPIMTDVPIIAMTAYALKGDKEKIWKAGFNGCLIKPIKRINLLIELMKYLPYDVHESTKIVPKQVQESESEKIELLLPDEIKPDLKDLFENEYTLVTKSYRIGQIKEFAIKLQQIASKHNTQFFNLFIDKINSECEALDMRALKKTLTGFAEIIEKENISGR